MSVFMTPELKPFLGGTYFPPADKYGRPGFSTLLRTIAQQVKTKGGDWNRIEGWGGGIWLVVGGRECEGKVYRSSIAYQWRNNRHRLTEQSAKIMDAISKAIEGDDTSSDRVPGVGCVQRAYETFNSRFDDNFGGFGDAPKFPQPGQPFCHVSF